MIRLTDLTRQWRREGRKTLVPFLTAGYPDRQTFAELTGAVARSGCRLMEIGVPFSDPVADGPVIQWASQAALDGGMTLRRALALVGEVRNAGALPVVMTYLNPVLRRGAGRFARRAVEAGATAGEHDARFHDVGAEFGRRLLERLLGIGQAECPRRSHFQNRTPF